MELVVYKNAIDKSPTRVNLYNSMVLFKYKRKMAMITTIWYTSPHHVNLGNVEGLEAAAPAMAMIHEMAPNDTVEIANGSLKKFESRNPISGD